MDREAGHYVCMREPVNIRQAIQMVRKYQQVHLAMYGKPEADQPLRREQCVDEDVQSVSQTISQGSSPLAQAGSAEGLEDIEQCLQTMKIQHVEARKPRWRPRPRFRACFNCGEKGHSRTECPNKT